MIKVLWVSNILFPEASAMLTGNMEQRGSGGWMLAAAKMIVEQKDYQLCVVTASSRVSQVTKLQGEKILYYVIPQSSSLRNYEASMEKVCNEYRPDLIHIHGTELPYGLACVNACQCEHVVVSIQGVMSEIAKYYSGGITTSAILKSITLRDLVKGTILQQKKLFEKRGKQEIELLKKVRHVIGRTSFDKAHALAINPNLTYHFCNETLRPEFYNHKWEYDKCEKHSIFLSQTRYPVKGAHVLFEALPSLLKKYPDLTVYVAGKNIVKGRIRLSGTGYGLILKKQIQRLEIAQHLHFMGALTASEMRDAMLKANVFVCPSSIENSSNSLGEAQLLGVPCVSSYVGGLPDFIPNKQMGRLYRFEDSTMLASEIEEIFDNGLFDNSIMRQEAAARHDASNNMKQTMSIYNSIMNEI